MNEGLANPGEMIFCPGSLGRNGPGKFDRAYDGRSKALPEKRGALVLDQPSDAQAPFTG